MPGLHRLSFALSLHRQVLLSSMSRLQPWSLTATEAFHVGTGSAARHGDSGMATDDLLAKVHDKELVKPLGFINGEWVGATDGSTIDVRLVRPHGCTVLMHYARVCWCAFCYALRIIS